MIELSQSKIFMEIRRVNGILIENLQHPDIFWGYTLDAYSSLNSTWIIYERKPNANYALRWSGTRIFRNTSWRLSFNFRKYKIKDLNDYCYSQYEEDTAVKIIFVLARIWQYDISLHAYPSVNTFSPINI